MTTMDFRNGSEWGRALHGSTFTQAKAKRLVDRIRDKLQGAYRATVMVHYPRRPKPGDVVLWNANAGEVSAEVYAVDPCGDPHDMYTLAVRVTPGKGSSK